MMYFIKKMCGLIKHRMKIENPPLVSIIIVNYNGRTNLEECLKSLMQITYKKFEVILVDNNSTDDSITFVKNTYPSVIIIKLDKNYGFAEPNNIGAKNAKGNFLLFLNNDTNVNPNFITELVNEITRDKKIAICQSLLLKLNGDVDSGGDFVDNLGRPYSTRVKPESVKPILSARGASMMIRKDVFFELEGFDKNFFTSFEDVDLGLRAWISGYKVVVVPKSVVYHKTGETVKKLRREVQFHGVKNTILLRLVNFEFSFALKSMVVLFFVSFMRKFFGVSVIKDPEEGPPLPSYKIIFKGLIWILKNFRYVMNKRKQVNSKRIRSTKDLIKLGLITKSN